MKVKVRKVVRVHKVKKYIAEKRYMEEIAKLVRGLTLDQLKDLIDYSRFLRDTGAGREE